MAKQETLYEILNALEENEEEGERENLYPSCTTRDYSPSNPWDAPGMNIKDFI